MRFRALRVIRDNCVAAGAALSGEPAVERTGRDGAEVLVFDLA